MAIKLFSRLRRRKLLAGTAAQPQAVTIDGKRFVLGPEHDLIRSDLDGRPVGVWNRSKNLWEIRRRRPEH